MPQLYNAAVMTNAGIALLNRAQAGEVSIQFTRMAAGDGVYTEGEKALSSLQGRTQLKSEKNSYPISSVGTASDNSVRLTAIITNQDPVTGGTLVSEGYYINEMGLYAREKDGGDSTEVLYSIVTVAAGDGDYMPPYNGHSPAQIVQEYHATVSNAAEVTIDCTGAALLVEDAERLLKEATAPMEGATETEDGKGGAVPAPGAGGADRYLGADGKWRDFPDAGARNSWGDNTVARSDSIAVGTSNINDGPGSAAFGEKNRIEQGNAGVIIAGSICYAKNPYTGVIGLRNVSGGTDSLVAGSCCHSGQAMSAVLGYGNAAETVGGAVCGRLNAIRESTAFNFTSPKGDAFVVGNGVEEVAVNPDLTNVDAGTALSRLKTYRSQQTLSNAFRVSYSGDTYTLKAVNSSGADYAEFIKSWSDGNPDGEDRVGYFVTIKDGYLHKADARDYIVGITSGNPSVVGNSDEDYYWRYERDAFNRIVMEAVPEIVVQMDGEGMPVLDGDGMPVLIDTGRTVKRMKLSEDYDKTLQDTYVERKDRPEWDYVGMLGVLPVRDDGTCVPGGFCRCKDGGIATMATERGFDTYMVIERITDDVVSVVLR